MCAIWEGVFRTFLQTIEARNRFYYLSPLLRAHFVVDCLCCLGCWPGQDSELAWPFLRVVSHQPAVHELIHRAATRLSDFFNPANQPAQNDDLRFSRGLLLFPLESNQLDGVEVDGEQRVIDRGRQVALIAPLRAKQLVQA